MNRKLRVPHVGPSLVTNHTGTTQTAMRKRVCTELLLRLLRLRRNCKDGRETAEAAEGSGAHGGGRRRKEHLKFKRQRRRQGPTWARYPMRPHNCPARDGSRAVGVRHAARGRTVVSAVTDALHSLTEQLRGYNT
ncbi:hypothetical protein BHE74_00029370 [Ensete ventricosum]|nr:hypothetical protein BHE74_00029370 [Ensete ventricosum]RZR97507.1 hypothetical protein BHM03_00026701 [Ensete ventricosum]